MLVDGVKNGWNGLAHSKNLRSTRCYRDPIHTLDGTTHPPPPVRVEISSRRPCGNSRFKRCSVGFSGFRVVKSTRSGTAEKICFSRRHVCTMYLSCVFPRETDRFSVPSFERRRGMKPLSQPTTLVDVFPCTRGCVPDSLFFSLPLFISLPPCLFLSFSLFFLLSCERMDAKGGCKYLRPLERVSEMFAKNLAFPILKGPL